MVEFFRTLVEVTLRGQVRLKLDWIQAVCTFVDIYEIDPRSGLRDRFRCGDKSMGHGYHYIASLNTSSHQSKANSVGPTRETHAVFAVAKTGEVPFESLDQRAANETSRLQDRLKNRH
jgi:hypothetical protein